MRERLHRYVDRVRHRIGGPDGVPRRLYRRLPSRYLVVPMVILIWILSGIYTVDSGELGAVQLFGKYDRLTKPGIHYHLPRPIERVRTCNVEEVRRYQVGPRNAPVRTAASPKTEVGEILLLTADQSLVTAELVVQAKISSVADFLWNLKRPEETMRAAGMATMSMVIGRYRFESVLGEGKQLEMEQQIRELLQANLDRYKCGMKVLTAKLKHIGPPDQLRTAFAEVTDAREQQRRAEADALKYANQLLPKAKGEAARLVADAEAFRVQRVKQAEGDAAGFLAQLSAYRQAPDVTRKRLYLETAEQIGGHAAQVVVAAEAQMVWPPLDFEKLARSATTASSSRQVPR